MSATAVPGRFAPVKPDPVPPLYSRAASDLRYTITLYQAEIDSAENQMPGLRRSENHDQIKHLQDIIAVRKEGIYQLEAGIEAGKKRAEAVPVTTAPSGRK